MQKGVAAHRARRTAPPHLLRFLAAALVFVRILPANPPPQVTPAPKGPLRVDGNRLVNEDGTPFLIRGTQLPEFPLAAAASSSSSDAGFGPYSPTTFSNIRLRWNMNTVRLPVNVIACNRQPNCLADLAPIVHRANRQELLVILAAIEPGTRMPSLQTVEFWKRCAAAFRAEPNLVFDLFSDPLPNEAHATDGRRFWWRGGAGADGRTVLGMQDLVHAIRSEGAAQPLAVSGWNDESLLEGLTPEGMVDDRNIIYEVNAWFRTTSTEKDRQQRFGFLAGRVPLLAAGWDLGLQGPESECEAIPQDPSAAEQLVENALRYFDESSISWVAPVYAPGELITDYRFQDATTLENGWTCGDPHATQAGLGQVVQFHLWNGSMRGLFATSQAGSFELPRSAVATLYGAIFGGDDAHASGPRLPTMLAGISLRVTDHLGRTTPAGLRYVSAGWGQIDFVVPPESAPGPARLQIARPDGTSAGINVTIVDIAPALVTAISNTHGPAVGQVIERLPDGRRSVSSACRCDSAGCRTMPIPVSVRGSTLLRLRASGFRHARSLSDIQVWVGLQAVPVVAFGPTGEPGVDRVTIRLPATLRNLGETEIQASVGGRLSNVALINLGSAENQETN